MESEAQPAAADAVVDDGEDEKSKAWSKPESVRRTASAATIFPAFPRTLKAAELARAQQHGQR